MVKQNDYKQFFFFKYNEHIWFEEVEFIFK